MLRDAPYLQVRAGLSQGELRPLQPEPGALQLVQNLLPLLQLRAGQLPARTALLLQTRGGDAEERTCSLPYHSYVSVILFYSLLVLHCSGSVLL